ncbi:MAG: 2-phospho-L-lactate guanylyltransferase [Gammaproteobacteria bacterium]|nr:2-phospho-L-lactate guanylyltransferase [Gammaproteobacteria bacterium]MCP4877385.1 2-phospho-L-lactate guanylyltransferase [Gammaproteobacteria bacterium]MCP4979336.1 2-phospho-L-lactate guanylyltransferase [Gammaproteobacteria bacterium]
MTSGSGIWAVVPVKSFSSAKSRLAGILQPVERYQLSRAMMTDVLGVLLASKRFTDTVVVTSDKEVADLAMAAGARVFRESTNQGPARAVTEVAQWLTGKGCQGIVGIMSDLPAISKPEIDKLLTSHGDSPAVTLAPSRDSTGTNAVVCSPPDIIELSFGAGSLSSHLQSAKRHSIEPNIIDLPGLGLDLDQPEDLLDFMKRGLNTHTTRYLRKRGIEKRYSTPNSVLDFDASQLRNG